MLLKRVPRQQRSGEESVSDYGSEEGSHETCVALRRTGTACGCLGSSLDAGLLGTMSLSLPDSATETPNI